MSEPRKGIDLDYCSAKEAEFKERSIWEATAEGRASFLRMAETWPA